MTHDINMKKTTQEILAQLERLEDQVSTAIELVRDPFKNPYNHYRKETPNSFRIGDFVVTDLMWTKNNCGPKGCGCETK